MPAANHPAFPFRTNDPLEPPCEYARLRAQEPVSRVTLPAGNPAWLITRHADVKRVLGDRRFSRAAITASGAPQVLPIVHGSKSLFVMDPPEHTRLRRLVSQAFTARRITALRPRIERLTDEMLDEMAAAPQPADLITHLAEPLPIAVICELLGVPGQDVPRFRNWTDVMLNFSVTSRDAVLDARKLLSEYLEGLIEQKHSDPGEDLLTALVRTRDDTDSLTDEELVAFGYTLLGAGYHATTATLAHAVLLLLMEPDRFARIHEDPRTVPVAVEELLRYSQAGIGIGALRIALEEVEVSGTLIRKGDAVLPSINAANRDEEVFTAAAELDCTRANNPHLTFGYGIHHCIGSQLGRVELEVAITALATRFPTLRLASELTHVQWVQGSAFRRPTDLPMSW